MIQITKYLNGGKYINVEELSYNSEINIELQKNNLRNINKKKKKRWNQLKSNKSFTKLEIIYGFSNNNIII